MVGVVDAGRANGDDTVRPRASAVGGHVGRGLARRQGGLRAQAAPCPDRRTWSDGLAVPAAFPPARSHARQTTTGSHECCRGGARRSGRPPDPQRLRRSATDDACGRSARRQRDSGTPSLPRRCRAIHDVRSQGAVSAADKGTSVAVRPGILVAVRRSNLAFADLRDAAKAAGGSVNDAFLSALLASFRIYSEEQGIPLDAAATMPVSVPVSVRREGDDSGGNPLRPHDFPAPSD